MCTGATGRCFHGKREKVAAQKDGQAQAPQTAQENAVETTAAEMKHLPGQSANLAKERSGCLNAVE